MQRNEGFENVAFAGVSPRTRDLNRREGGGGENAAFYFCIVGAAGVRSGNEAAGVY